MVNNEFNSKNYWENRYKNNGNSGLGSYGDEAIFKSEYINNFIKKYEIKTINDFGCGDSNQISMFDGFEKYNGYDVSQTILDLCTNKFKLDNRYNFLNNINNMVKADVTFSLDVTYHITEDKLFDEYMKNIFSLTNNFVLIYSINKEYVSYVPHIKHRKFTDWVDKNYPNFELIDEEIFTSKGNGVGFFLFRKK